MKTTLHVVPENILTHPTGIGISKEGGGGGHQRARIFQRDRGVAQAKGILTIGTAEQFLMWEGGGRGGLDSDNVWGEGG